MQKVYAQQLFIKKCEIDAYLVVLAMVLKTWKVW